MKMFPLAKIGFVWMHNTHRVEASCGFYFEAASPLSQITHSTCNGSLIITCNHGLFAGCAASSGHLDIPIGCRQQSQLVQLAKASSQHYTCKIAGEIFLNIKNV